MPVTILYVTKQAKINAMPKRGFTGAGGLQPRLKTTQKLIIIPNMSTRLIKEKNTTIPHSLIFCFVVFIFFCFFLTRLGP